MNRSAALACLLALSLYGRALAHGVAEPGLKGVRQGASFVLPIVKRDYLLNGLQLIVLEQQETGSVSLRLRINSGAMFDLAGKGGLAEITAQALLKGGGGYNARAVADSIEDLKIAVSATTDWDATEIAMSGPADSLEAMFDLLGRLVITPAFDQKELDVIKAQRAEASKAEGSVDAEAVKRKALELVFGSHPFGRPARGTPESISQISRADLVYYHNKFYVANNAELIVTGDATAEQVTKSARTKLGAWKKGEKVPATFRPPDPLSSRKLIILDRPDASLAYAAFAQLGISRRAADFLAAAILIELLNRASSQIAGAGQGVVIETENAPRLLAGPMMVKIKSSSNDLPRVIDALLAEVSRLQSTQPSLEQMEWAKSRLISSIAERLRSTDGSAGLMLDIELYGLGRDYLVSYVDRVNAVTAADVARAAQNYLKPEAMAVVVAGPAAKLEGELKKLGAITVQR